MAHVTHCQVVKDTASPSVRILQMTNPVPSLPRTNERFLDQVLSPLKVSGKQVRLSDERSVNRLVEPIELPLGLLRTHQPPSRRTTSPRATRPRASKCNRSSVN